jgi:hypothetical protein
MYTGSFGPASNRADYRETIALRITAEDAAPVLDEIEIAMGEGSCVQMRKRLSSDEIGYDTETGEFTFVFSASELRRFAPGSYPFGIVLTIDGAREQLFAGQIVVIDGVVS